MSVDQQLLDEGIQQLKQDRSALKSMISRMGTAIENVEGAASNRDPVPIKFAGLIENYRFTTGRKGDMPSHRFEVVCGNGLSLHVEASSESFADAMREMTMGEITTSKLNGKLCIVGRTANGLVPIEVKADEVPGAKDRMGNWLWLGARVSLVGSADQGVGIVANVEDDEILVQFNENDVPGVILRGSDVTLML